MKAAVAVGIGVYLDATFGDAGLLPVRFAAFGIVVRVDEVLASVVRRVDVDALDSLAVSAGEELKHLQVLALNNHVAAGFIRIDGANRVVNQGGTAGRERL